MHTLSIDMKYYHIITVLKIIETQIKTHNKNGTKYIIIKVVITTKSYVEKWIDKFKT